MILLAIIIVFIVLCIISFSFDKREDEIKLLRNYLSDKASEVDTLTKTIMGLNQDLSEKEAYIADIQDIVSNLRIKATRLEGVTAERDRFKQENITLRLWAEKELSRKDEAIREFEQKYADIEREEISKRKDTEKRCQLLDLENEKLRKKLSDKIEVLRQSLQIIHEMQNDLAQGYPSVIEALDMYAEILDRQIADSLIHKVTPAPRAADIVKEETARRREAEKRCRLLGFENDQLRQKIEAPSSEVGLRPETELVSNEEIISTLTQKLSEKTEELQQALQVIYELKTDLAHGFPTLVETLDAYAVLLDSRTVDNLINKSTSAPKSADVVREETLKRRDAEKRCRLLGFENDQLRRKLETLTGEAESRREAEKQNSILRAENSKLQASVQGYIQALQDSKNLLRKTLSEPPLGFPSLLELLRHYDEKQDRGIYEYLKTKSHPAFTAAQIVRAESRKRRAAEYDCRRTRLILDYYLSVLPDAQDEHELTSEKIDMTEAPPENTDEDIAGRYLSNEEYYSLSITERNQLALDRFWARKKSKQLIGRLYEQYIGYLYERDGWLVEYFGINKGFSDLGRDLLCHKDNTTLIVQCKNWSHSKTIYEKHIFQLFGTTYEYMKKNPFEEISGVFYTSTSLSELARSFAREFHIEFHENFRFEQFPIIKCNIGKEGERIYHLPFDQQYYTTRINPKDGDFYCMTVAEAEAKGFRRAYRWHGSKDIL